MVVPKPMIGIDGKLYKVLDDTWYHKDTSDKVILVLDTARKTRTRLRITYGNTETGLADGYMGYHDCGRIGRSTGPIKIPLLVCTKRSLGGPSLMEHIIVRIEYSNKLAGGVLYQHPTYHTKEERNESAELLD